MDPQSLWSLQIETLRMLEFQIEERKIDRLGKERNT